MVVYMQERKSLYISHNPTHNQTPTIFEEYQYNSNLQVLLLLHVN